MFKFFLQFLFVFAVILAMASAADDCLADGAACHESGSMGWCCTGYCYRQVGQDAGDCRMKPI